MASRLSRRRGWVSEYTRATGVGRTETGGVGAFLAGAVWVVDEGDVEGGVEAIVCCVGRCVAGCRGGRNTEEKAEGFCHDALAAWVGEFSPP